MNTSDFSRFKKDPDPQFADQLYERITSRKSMIARLNAILREPSSLLRAGLLLVTAIVIVAACARQLFAPRNIQIGSMWLHEMSEDAVCGEDIVYPNYTPSGPMPTPQHSHPVPTMISLNEFMERAPYKIEIPTWAPEGFVLYPEVVVTYRAEGTPIEWRNSNVGVISLWTSPSSFWPRGREIRAAYGSWEEVSVNGAPAIMVRGTCMYSAFSSFTGRSESEYLSLHWSRNGTEYTLISISSDIDPDTLIHMAESAR